VRSIPVTPHSEVVAAGLVVQIIIEAAELPILKSHACQTGSAGHGRGHHFHDNPESPHLIVKMGDFIADTEKKSFAFSERAGAFVPVIMLNHQINIRGRRPHAMRR